MLRLRSHLRVQIRPPRFYPDSRRLISATPTVRHVRFKRPWFRFRSFFFKSLFTIAAFHVWSSYLLRIEDDTENISPSSAAQVGGTVSTQKSESKLHDSEEGKYEEEHEEPMFIPLTWSWVEEGELYTSSDPEWQKFVQISKDRQKLQKLRDELAQLVLKSASEQLSQILGGPISLTGFWLVHQFPHRAPPEHLRSGIEISDDGLAWVTRPIEPDVGDRIQSSLKPLHVALAIKDASLIMLRRQLARLRGEPSHPLELLFERQATLRNEKFNPFSPHEKPKLQPSITEGSSDQVKDTRDVPLHPSWVISILQRFPMPNLGPGSDLHLASIAFQARLKEYRAQQPRTPLRGTFIIAGPVGLKGPNGFCRFEVRGEYDPAKPGWRTIEMKLRDVNFRKQKALG